MDKYSKNNKINYLLFILSAVLSIFLVEAYLAFTMPVKKNTSSRAIVLRENRPSITKKIFPSKRQINRSDNLDNKEYILEIDENGYVAPSKIYDEPDVNIVFLGGSTTENIFMDEDSRFPYLAGRIIDKELNKKINSYNCGLSGNHTLHSINLFLNKALELDPDIAVMMHNVNDLTTLIHEGKYWNKGSRKLVKTIVSNPPYNDISITKIIKSFLPRLYYRLYLFKKQVLAKNKVLEDEFADKRNNSYIIDEKKILKNIASNFNIFISICNSYNISPVLMTQPNRFNKNIDKKLLNIWWHEENISHEKYSNIYHKINNLIKKIGEENDVLVIDLESKVPKNSKYMYDLVHLTDYGSKFASKIIAENLQKLIF